MTTRWATPWARGDEEPSRPAEPADMGEQLSRGSTAADEGPKRPIDDVSFGVQVAAWWSICVLLILAAITALGALLSHVYLVTVTITIAVMLCALLEPAVRILRGFGLPRPLAALLVFVLGIAAIAFLTWYALSQIAAAKDVLITQVQDAADTIRHWLVHGPLHVAPAQADKYTTNLGDTLAQNQGNILSGVASQASGALGILSGAVLCLFATLFMLLDNGSMWRWVVRLAPVHSRAHVATAGAAAWRTLTAYMRSLVLLGGINALAMVPAMWIAGLPLVAPLAVLIFLGSLVPLIGVIVAGVIVCLIALVTKGVATAIVMAVVLVLIVQLFGNLLNPIILGKAVDLHPLAILVTVTAGTLLAGAFGAFVGVPLVAVLNNGVKAIRNGRSPDSQEV
ncbi:AI-2E family transporter [Allobranchiibius sp. CTAmp26]|uniref:AI-2E family transporter n=1 Tax=Allobranchiibius sp. CTAmp26 TaxID=2815214 RepID=UPI001AA13F4B|nr:AI-2E family transporter [Allobranchiibius sp. CTAmp26]MBO1753999.1 AI-2E family transporter [Allobranchiibius sp. CTAmp26]